MVQAKTEGRLLDPLPFVPDVVARWISAEPEILHRRIRASLLHAKRPDDPGHAISVATSLGGDLLKFLGEDLLFLFDGPSADERVVAAAGELDASRIASGPVDLFLVGCSHRELFVSENAVESLATAAPTFTRKLVDVNAIRRCVPEVIRSNAASWGARNVAVASVHLANLDELVRDAGPNAVERHLTDLVSSLDHSLAEHDITFIGSDTALGGPRIICATGIVRPRPNDDQRLLHALREIVDYPSAIELRIGLDRGMVEVRIEGIDARRALTLRGDVVDTATRLMEDAERSEIAATSRVVERLRASAAAPPSV